MTGPGTAARIDVLHVDDEPDLADPTAELLEQADEREAVFDAGYSTAEEGTGLGLSIVTQVAEDHGWTVATAKSDAGGARVEVTGVEFVD